MKNLIHIYKPKGMTPLEMISRLKNKYPSLAEKKMSYAGRLDPLAHGVLLLVIDKETKHKEKYLNLPKTYEFEILLGLKTDTYDILGYLEGITIKNTTKNVNTFVNTFVKEYTGNKIQSYPPYSSKTVNGKPLFWYARNGMLNVITIPKHKITISKFAVIQVGQLSLKALEQKIVSEIALVKGDFRQTTILKRWKEFFSHIDNPKQKFVTVKFHIECSSGTYVRGLAEEIGKKIGSGAIAIDILRTSIDKYSLDDVTTL